MTLKFGLGEFRGLEVRGERRPGVPGRDRAEKRRETVRSMQMDRGIVSGVGRSEEAGGDGQSGK